MTSNPLRASRSPQRCHKPVAVAHCLARAWSSALRPKQPMVPSSRKPLEPLDDKQGKGCLAFPLIDSDLNMAENQKMIKHV